jgi:hypothetical protein
MTQRDEIHELELQIQMNEMLPLEMQCSDAIKKMKAKLARLRRGLRRHLVTEKEARHDCH